MAHNADVNAKGGLFDTTPLHNAIDQGHREVAKFLITKKCDVSARSDPGETPLHVAVKKGDTDMVKFLISHGARVNAGNNWGNTPLGYAETEEMKQLLHSHGAKSGKELQGEEE